MSMKYCNNVLKLAKKKNENPGLFLGRHIKKKFMNNILLYFFFMKNLLPILLSHILLNDENL